MLAVSAEIFERRTTNAKTNRDSCWSLSELRIFGHAGERAIRQEQASQPTGDSKLRLGRRKNAHGGLFKPKDEGPQDFWRFGSLRTAVARWSKRSDHVCDAGGFEGRRKRCASRRLYDFHDSRRKQMDAYRQQENGGMGD